MKTIKRRRGTPCWLLAVMCLVGLSCLGPSCRCFVVLHPRRRPATARVQQYLLFSTKSTTTTTVSRNRGHQNHNNKKHRYHHSPDTWHQKLHHLAQRVQNPGLADALMQWATYFGSNKKAFLNPHLQEQIVVLGQSEDDIAIRLQLVPLLVDAQAVTAAYQIYQSIVIAANNNNNSNHAVVVAPATVAILLRGLRSEGHYNMLFQVYHGYHNQRTSNNSNTAILQKIYLAALCDVQDFDQALEFLSHKKHEEATMVEYNTILGAAAKAGRASVVQDVWKVVQNANNSNLQPDSFTATALLQVVQPPTKRLEYWENLQGDYPSLQLNGYVFDLLLASMNDTTRPTLEALLEDHLLKDNNNTRISPKDFASFLTTLVQADQVPIASAWLHTYVLQEQHSIAPVVQHFNILLAAYDQTKDFAAAQALRGHMDRLHILPDAYTTCTLLGFCSTSDQVTECLYQHQKEQQHQLDPTCVRAAMTRYGQLLDPSAAIACLQSSRLPVTTRFLNCLLAALRYAAAAADPHNEKDNGPILVHVQADNDKKMSTQQDLFASLAKQSPMTPVQAALAIFQYMSLSPASGLRLEGLTVSLVASILQYQDDSHKVAMQVFRNATAATTHGMIRVDGRTAHAVLRCFGPHVQSAVDVWRTEIRPVLLEQGNPSKNLMAAYPALFYVCGRALRPDLALRLTYAMEKEGYQDLSPSDVCYNCYQSGKRQAIKRRPTSNTVDGQLQRLPGFGGKASSNNNNKPSKIPFMGSYESMLEVECLKYDPKDKRRKDDQRIRIIV